MSNPPPIPATSGTGPDRAAWLARIRDLAEEEDGTLTPLGARHWALSIEAGAKLLVTFDTVGAAAARKDGLPRLQEFAALMGWSYLCILAEGQTWFRDPAVYGHFDVQVMEGQFDEYDRVLFYGAGMEGHAAAAYSVAAPGAVVLAVAPRASMAPARVPFETRDRSARRLDFSSRYGFAPDMVRGAGAVWILRDPGHALDAAQAAMFQGRHVRALNLRHLGAQAEQALIELDILPQLLAAAMKDEMSEALFARLWRARRAHMGYLGRLVLANTAPRHEARAHAICANVVRRTGEPAFRDRLEALEAARAASASQPA